MAYLAYPSLSHLSWHLSCSISWALPLAQNCSSFTRSISSGGRPKDAKRDGQAATNQDCPNFQKRIFFSTSLSTAGVRALLTDESTRPQVSLKSPHWITDPQSSGELCAPRNVSRFASSIMHLWFSWQMWSSMYSQAIPWWPHMCTERP